MLHHTRYFLSQEIFDYLLLIYLMVDVVDCWCVVNI